VLISCRNAIKLLSQGAELKAALHKKDHAASRSVPALTSFTNATVCVQALLGTVPWATAAKKATFRAGGIVQAANAQRGHHRPEHDEILKP